MESSQGTRLPNRLCVGCWLVERDACRLSRGAEQVHVRPLLVDLLLLLAEHRGEIVSKDLLLDRLWGGRFVSESLLTRTIAELRHLGLPISGGTWQAPSPDSKTSRTVTLTHQ